MTKKKKNDYSADKITILKGVEAVRKRPAMYIGDSSTAGLHHLIYEIVDNAIDEALAGYAKKVSIKLEKDGAVRIEDDGRGIPTDIHKETGKSALETIMTTLHSGGKFDHEAYKVSSGLHGVGASVVNALSKKTIIEIHRDGEVFKQEYEEGKPKKDVEVVGKTDRTGTIITFKPDPKIFDTTKFNLKTLYTRFRQQAYLTAGLTIRIIDERKEEERTEQEKKIPRDYSFHFENGVRAYITQINKSHKPIHKNIFYVRDEIDEIEVEVALQYSDDIQEKVMVFANNVHNPEGGTHLSGFRTALTKTLNDYLDEHGSEKEKEYRLAGQDSREGLTAIVSVKLNDPQFEGQTKIKLNNPEVLGVVRKVVEKDLNTFLEEHPKDAKSILSRALLSFKARKAAKAAREAVVRKGAMGGGTLPGKLSDCSSRIPEECELYIVEGDSAGGSAKQGRDRKKQAILPLSGKPINSEKYRIDRVLGNEKLKDIVIALGTGIGETFQEEKLRYHKIIIMNDADVDGEHITTLVLTFFFRHFRPLIEKGYLYVAQPPLFKIELERSGGSFYIKDEGQKEKRVEELKKEGKKIKHIQRFKGLGEMNPEQLWETTMNPENRTLKQITITDAEEADRVFEMLMGTEVKPRRQFIQRYSQEAEIDI
ncbi:DNA gyrase subunit B [Candidatus Dojkabacteria bacterium]|nr:DNA gyrase subunit B [Candidatus Dojkabacteria bacterium]